MLGNPKEQLRQFLAALFDQHDIVEIRPIEIWRNRASGNRHSRVLSLERRWWTPDEILASYSKLLESNVKRHANIFMGVNPRSQVGGAKKRDVVLCRCLWADMDEVTPEVARWRCQEVGVPDPSVLVDSGSGVHLYWVLDAPVVVVDDGERQRFERRLKSLYRLLGCDATSDVNRLLRLPGFSNLKDGRNGAPAVPCKLVQCRPNRRINLGCLPDIPEARLSKGIRRRSVSRDIEARTGTILSRLDVPVSDRSRRDFGVICELLRQGMSPEEIWLHVAGRSKFATHGYRYFLTTLKNAWDAVAAR